MIRLLRRVVERGDFDELAAILAPGVALLIDGGGQVVVTHDPIRGVVDVSARLLALLGPGTGLSVTEQSVNGQSGLLARRGHLVVGVLTVNTRDDRIADIWVVVNPDKLRSFNR
jgi:RNA polymerase sigma-70 factor (ECF subfamily)